MNNFSDLKNDLSEQDINEILQLVGKGCRDKTKIRLRTILNQCPRFIEDCGIMRRLTKEPHGWEYCAGQDYVSEIKTVREVILGRC